MIIVSDTTPLNYLILINQAHLLRELYSSVTIPQTVYEEMQRASAPEKVRTWINHKPEWLNIRPAQATEVSLKLGAGEREAIALAVELQANIILLDDRKARQEAHRQGLMVTGTLAVLAIAAQRGLVDLPTAFARLRQTTFRAPEELIQSLLDQCHKAEDG